MARSTDLSRRVARASLAAAKQLEADLKLRIFNQGGATEGDIGPYRDKAYKKKRNKAGRKTDKKNLQFYGDHRRNIQPAAAENGAVIGFLSKDQLTIAGQQEKYAKKRIYRPRQSEIDRAKRTFQKAFRAGI